MLSAGNLIGGRYRLVRLIGEGGMGTVWAAINEAFGREVAVKVMLREVAADPTALERFLTEARICGTIRHPGIVDVLDVGQTQDGAPFLVMELLDGEALDGILRRCGTLRPLDILPVVRDVARTLALAHEREVIHRDIKPGNIFLHRLPNGQMVAKVLDFGISKVNRKSSPSPTMTQTGTVVGSPAYMSPEQAAGRVELDARSDVYGLGVILYEVLSGRLPFQTENYNALIIDIAVREPPALGTIVTGLPKPVLELVKATMMHDREQRIPSAIALAERIEATLAALGASPNIALPDPASLGRGSAPTTASQTARAAASQRAVLRTRRVSRLAVAGIATTTVLVAGGAALAVLKPWSPASPPTVAVTATPSSTAGAAPSVTASAVPAGSAAPADTASAAPTVTASAAPIESAAPADTAPLPTAHVPASAARSPSSGKAQKGAAKTKNKGVLGYD
ncbi:Serine/threonine-protein kinase pkn3 [Minicystis rosea]|nr:Serine/threonine-protein kinase pkn3 [Minicystis rosea]